MKKIGVLGSGAWATTIAKLCAENGHATTLLCHDQKYVEAINTHHENKLRLPNIALPTTLKAEKIDQATPAQYDAIILGVPSVHIPSLTPFFKRCPSAMPILVLTKGLMTEQTPFVSTYLEHAYGFNDVSLLSGPNLAYEIAKGLPAATVIAGNTSSVEMFQSVLSAATFRCYTSRDKAGVEAGGVVKNVIAIAAGISDGLNLGQNALSALISRGLMEMARIGEIFGAKKDTVFGLSGNGDLITTCSSDLSRNKQVGYHIVNGELPNSDAQTGSVAEGVRSAAFLHDIGVKKGISLPIVNAVYDVIYNKKNPKESIQSLMQRDLKAELE